MLSSAEHVIKLSFDKRSFLATVQSMAWLRIVRPGSVIGPQQQYLKEKEPLMWSLKLSGGTSKHISIEKCHEICPAKEPRGKARKKSPLTKE